MYSQDRAQKYNVREVAKREYFIKRNTTRSYDKKLRSMPEEKTDHLTRLLIQEVGSERLSVNSDCPPDVRRVADVVLP